MFEFYSLFRSYLQTSLLKNGLKTETEDDELNSSTQDQVAAPSSQLSDEEIKIWKPLFEALDKESPDFIPFFLVSILDPQSVNMENDIRINHLMPWVLWVLQRCSTFTAKFPWLSLLEICMKNPNPFTREFVTLILKEMPPVQDTLKQNILSLINIDQVEDSFVKCPDEAYEFRSLEQILEINGSESIKQPVQENGACLSSGWSESRGDTKWDLISFGEILGCEYQSVNLLELPELSTNLSQIENDNSAIHKDVVGDIDFTEEDTEMVNGIDESEVINRIPSKNDATFTDNAIEVEVATGASESFDKEELEAEICLF